MSLPVTDVAACIILSPEGRVLLAERTARQIAAGFWEVPGGKIEPGEPPAKAALRELQEETGVTATGLTPWMSYTHRFATKELRLHFFRAQAWQGSAHGREGQRLAWVDPRAPHVGPILQSNDRVLFSLRLPPIYAVGNFGMGGTAQDFLAGMHSHLSLGARLMRVRLAAMTPGQAAALLGRVAGLAAAFPGACILAGTAMEANRAGLAGVHSSASQLWRMSARPAVRVWAATCHDAADLGRALSLGADFVVLAPVLADAGQGPHQAIGWDGLRALASSCPVPVYAEGGLTPGHAALARQAGAHGLALSIAQGGHAKEAWAYREKAA